MVCILGIQNKRENYKQIYEAFKEQIARLESKAFESAKELKGNFNDKVHRIQFGFLYVEKNAKVRDQLLENSKMKNPKFVVIVSTLNLVQVFNNLGLLKRRFGEFGGRSDFWGIRGF